MLLVVEWPNFECHPGQLCTLMFERVTAWIFTLQVVDGLGAGCLFRPLSNGCQAKVSEGPGDLAMLEPHCLLQ